MLTKEETMILVQQIETIWSKKSRASENATIRNSVPNVFEAPPMEENDHIHQLLTFDEKSNFQTPVSKIKPFNEHKKDNYFGALRIYEENDQIKTIYTYSPKNVGAPDRSTYPKQVLTLNIGEWGQIVYTGRYCVSSTGYGDWFYKKSVFNIAYMNKLNRSVFVKSEPKRTFEDIANLR